jgi:hypothetical protein
MPPTPKPDVRRTRRMTVAVAAATAVIAVIYSTAFAGGADALTHPTSTPSRARAEGSPRLAADHSAVGRHIATRKSTGVPDGYQLRTYSGSCTINHSETIVGVDATRCGSLLIDAPNVVIEDSLVPVIDASTDRLHSVTIRRSTVQAGHWEGGGLWGSHILAVRVEVTGGQHSVQCTDDCRIYGSWLHQQWNPSNESFHNNAFISNGGSHMVLRNNRLHCTAILNSNDGGCTADVSLFGDFGTISDVLVDHNLLMANDSSISYCAYGGYSSSKAYPIADHIVFTDNIFQRGPNHRCGVFGPVTAFQAKADGNEWSGNHWDDGKPLGH